MSLRGQVVLSVILALLLGLSAMGTLACWQARRSVTHEMHVALEAADRVVDNALLSLPGAGADAYLIRLVGSFDGNRHVRVRLIKGADTLATSQGAPYEAAPAWFVRLLGIPMEERRDASPGMPEFVLLVSSSPHNEISESWLQFRDGALILGLFSLILLAFLHMVMAHASVQLSRLVAGFEAVGGGKYDDRIILKGPRDLAQLGAAFNRMTERLELLESANRRMSSQMLAIQEEERADLARDLHDEMGPFLFALRVEADAIARQTQEQGIVARAHAIGEAVTHIQAHVRSILRQLRPGELTETGLRAGIVNLATFLQQRHDAIAISLDLSAAAQGFSPEIDAGIYRVVQEALTNAARHSGARQVWVSVRTMDGHVTVTVDDDGRGFGGAHDGIGLKGMRERLAALSGTLELSARQGGGARLRATIPHRSMAIPA
jgi:two-component system sensor histidine kinase UhpB